MFKNIKKLILFLFLIIFCVYPTIIFAEGDSQSTTSSTDPSIVDLAGTMLLLNPITFPIGASIKATTSLITGADSCVGVSIINPYCAIINVIIDIQRYASPVIVSFGQTLLTYSTNPELLSEASDLDNAIIQSGWSIVRNIANAALVIGLVIIAITIILGYQENKAKQLLITFILIALLINFTPVICGFIIDGANIITNSFLAGGTDTGYSGAIKNSFSLLKNDTTIDIQTKLVYGSIITVFSLIAAVIMALYALLFIARTVILWLLVIISPIAFATKVFPQSKYIKKIFPSVTYWDDWWESFVQWAVIGIPAAVSLYISMQLMAVTQVSVSNMTSTGSLDVLVAYIAPFIFLLAGFLITISAGGQVGSFVGGIATGAFAATAGRAIGWGKEKAKAGGEWALGGAERTAAGVAVGLGSGLTNGFNDTSSTGILSKTKNVLVGGATGAALGGMTPEGREKAAEKIAEIKEGIGWTKRGEYASKIESDVSEAQKRTDNLSDDDLKKESMGSAETRQGNIDKAAMFRSLNKRGKLDKPQLEYLSNNKNWAETYNVGLKDISKARPDYAQQLVNKSPYEVVSGMSPSDAGKKINPAAFSSPTVLFSTHYNVVNGKIKKGSAEDIKNIKTGLINELNTYLSSIPGTNFTQINEDNIADQIQANANIIDTHIETLLNSGDAASRIKGQTLSELIDHVVDENI